MQYIFLNQLQYDIPDSFCNTLFVLCAFSINKISEIIYFLQLLQHNQVDVDNLDNILRPMLSSKFKVYSRYFIACNVKRVP